MRIIFVGVHNKPNLQPLCSSTKTGKLVNRIINELPKHVIIEKTNLFDVDYLPEHQDLIGLGYEWYYKHLPTNEDIVILLGATVHNSFRHDVENLIKIGHPASKWSHKDMDEYVLSAAGKIKKSIVKVDVEVKDKPLNMPDINEHRELLIAFSKKTINISEHPNATHEKIVDGYMKSNL